VQSLQTPHYWRDDLQISYVEIAYVQPFLLSFLLSIGYIFGKENSNKFVEQLTQVHFTTSLVLSFASKSALLKPTCLQLLSEHLQFFLAVIELSEPKGNPKANSIIQR
jgi:hypothetical protein